MMDDNLLHIPEAATKRVVVAGGGFGGIYALKALRKSNLQLVLIDKNNYHQFQPLLYQVATSALDPSSISFPLRPLFKDYPDFHFIMSTIERIDPDQRLLYTRDGQLSYDYLILALGSDTNYYGLESIQKVGLGLKSVTESLALRNRVYSQLEKASQTADIALRDALLSFIVVGGGSTGVELAGALAELKKKVLPHDYPEINIDRMKIQLLNASERLLETFSEASSEQTLQDLRNMGVEVMLNATVSDYADGCVVYNNDRRIRTENVIWVSGVSGNKIEGLDAVGRGGRLQTDAYCRVFRDKSATGDVFENLFAVGDMALIPGNPLPQVAQVAIQEGQYVARLIQGQTTKPFAYVNKGSMSTIGRNKAITRLKGHEFHGFWAWLLWLFVHLLYIIGVRNKFLVVTNWAWNYLTNERPLRSIIRVKTGKEDNCGKA